MCIWKTTQNAREVKGYSIILSFYFLISFHFENYPVLFSLYNLLLRLLFFLVPFIHLALHHTRLQYAIDFFHFFGLSLPAVFVVVNFCHIVYFIGFIFTHLYPFFPSLMIAAQFELLSSWFDSYPCQFKGRDSRTKKKTKMRLSCASYIPRNILVWVLKQNYPTVLFHNYFTFHPHLNLYLVLHITGNCLFVF